MSKHSDRAQELFKMGYNCSQAVLGAFIDTIDLNLDTALKISSSFGGGMGRMREVCGALTGEFMVAGLLYASTDSKAIDSKTKHYKLIQEIAAEFKRLNGSIICRELLGLSSSGEPKPETRDDNYYKKRPCVELVRLAAEHMDSIIESNVHKD